MSLTITELLVQLRGTEKKISSQSIVSRDYGNEVQLSIIVSVLLLLRNPSCAL